VEISSWKKYLAEAIGTMVLTFMGCGAAVVLGTKVGGGHLAVAFAFGLSIVACAYVIGNVSGCHINPAVSLGVFLNGGMKALDFVGYVISQIIGAIAGAALLKVLVSFGVKDLTGGLGSNGLTGVGGSAAAGLFVEIILTFIFVLVILGVTSKDKFSPVAGLVIGLTLTFVHIVGIPLTGTSVNPARSIGPALFAGGAALSSLWVFIVGPLVGAALAALVFRLVLKTKDAA